MTELPRGWLTASSSGHRTRYQPTSRGVIFTVTSDDQILFLSLTLVLAHHNYLNMNTGYYYGLPRSPDNITAHPRYSITNHR